MYVCTTGNYLYIDFFFDVDRSVFGVGKLCETLCPFLTNEVFPKIFFPITVLLGLFFLFLLYEIKNSGLGVFVWLGMVY